MAQQFTGPKPVFRNKIPTPVGRLCYPHLDKPSAGFEGNEPKFSVEILIPKTTNIDHIKAQLVSLANEAFGKFQPRGADGKPNGAPRDWKLSDFGAAELPIRDGDAKAAELEANEKDGSAYVGQFYIRAKSKRRPDVVDAAKAPLAPEAVYGGCYGRLVLSAMSYKTPKGSRPAMTFLLDAVQFVKDGERFGGTGGGGDPLAALPDDLPADSGNAAVADGGEAQGKSNLFD